MCGLVIIRISLIRFISNVSFAKFMPRCERVHSVTDTMLLKLKAQCPDTELEVLLCWANMARNSLQMWHGFSSYQLVFGQNPNLPNIMTAHPPAFVGSTTSEVLAKHLNSLHAARKAFIESESAERIRRALRSKVRAAEQKYEHGDRVFYKRDGQDRWLGPGKVVFQDGKVIFVRHGGVFVRVSPNRLVKFESEFMTGESQEEEVLTRDSDLNKPKGNIAQSIVETIDSTEKVMVDDEQLPAKKRFPKKDDIIDIETVVGEPWVSATVLGRGGKASGKHKDWVNVEFKNGDQGCINIENTQWRPSVIEQVNIVLLPKTRHNESKCVDAKLEEIRKLKDFDTYDEVEDMGQFQLSTTWVLWEKGDEVRARLVARGYEEPDEIQKDSPTISKSGMRTFLAMAASHEWTIKTTDIKSAFLQGNPLKRDVYIQPPKEAKVQKGFIWKLKKCLYGLHDAARKFFNSIYEALKRLQCQQSHLDPALFYFYRNDTLSGLFACHVDDFLHAGNQYFDELVMKNLRDRFLAGKLEEGIFKYVGFQIIQTSCGIVLDQGEYVDGLDIVKIDSTRLSQKLDKLTPTEHTLLRAITGRLNWAVQGSRPDLAFDMIDLSMKFKMAVVADLLQAIKSISKLKQNDSKIYFPNIGEIRNCSIVTFSDAAHANLSDGVSSAGAHIVFLVGDKNKCCVLSWQAQKIKRVVRSSIAAETLSLQESLENAVYLRSLIEEILRITSCSIAIDAVVDNRSVVEAIHSTKFVDDKYLRINIAAIKESIQTGQVRSVRWCPGSIQLANVLTKRGAQSRLLLDILQSGQLNLEGWKVG